MQVNFLGDYGQSIDDKQWWTINFITCGCSCRVKTHRCIHMKTIQMSCFSKCITIVSYAQPVFVLFCFFIHALFYDWLHTSHTGTLQVQVCSKTSFQYSWVYDVTESDTGSVLRIQTLVWGTEEDWNSVMEGCPSWSVPAVMFWLSVEVSADDVPWGWGVFRADQTLETLMKSHQSSHTPVHF